MSSNKHESSVEQSSVIRAKPIWTGDCLLSQCPFSSSERSYLLWDVAQIMSKDGPIWPCSGPNRSKLRDVRRGNSVPWACDS